LAEYFDVITAISGKGALTVCAGHGGGAAAPAHRRRSVRDRPGHGSVAVTISIGIAALIGREDNAVSVFKRADRARYRAKRDGRNRVVPAAA
jgi:GGDEF domain-containing protein